jgi:hypothetical protein
VFVAVGMGVKVGVAVAVGVGVRVEVGVKLCGWKGVRVIVAVALGPARMALTGMAAPIGAAPVEYNRNTPTNNAIRVRNATPPSPAKSKPDKGLSLLVSLSTTGSTLVILNVIY